MDNLISLAKVNWKKVDSYNSLEKEIFPMMRAFGTKQEMEELKKKVLAVADVTCVVLSDIITIGVYILMVTEKHVDKGHCLLRLKDHYNWEGCVIGCGDDMNDLPLFEVVDISICMENGKKELLEKATIIAKPSYQMGIIDALEQAIGMIK